MICYWFPPCSKAGALRSAALARHLPKYGWHPLVVTPAEKYVERGGMEPEAQELADTCRIIRTRTFDPIVLARMRRKGSGTEARKVADVHARILGRSRYAAKPLLMRLRELLCLFGPLDEQTAWVPFAVWAAWKLRKQWDVLYTTFGPPVCFVAGYIIKVLTGKPWLADFRDPWTWRGTMPFATTAHRRLCVALERKGVAAADAVTSVTPDLTDMLAELAPAERHKFATVYNGFEETVMPQPSGEAFSSRPLRMIFAGSIYRGRSFSVLLEATARLVESGQIDKRDIRFEAIGIGVEIVRDTAAALGISECVETSGHIPRGDVLQRVSRADVGLLPIGEVVLALPTKMYEYMGCGKPILVVGGETTQAARFTRENRLGWVVDPHDIEGATRLISGLVSREPELMVQAHLDPTTVARFSREAQTEHIATILDGLYARRHRKS